VAARSKFDDLALAASGVGGTRDVECATALPPRVLRSHSLNILSLREKWFFFAGGDVSPMNSVL
jgi:hypothetical protein